MQANLFKILAITAAFSMVQSAPVETAEGQATQGQVNGTQINEAHINEAHVNEADVDDVTLSVSDMDVLNAIFTLHRVAIHTRDAISAQCDCVGPEVAHGLGQARERLLIARHAHAPTVHERAHRLDVAGSNAHDEACRVRDAGVTHSAAARCGNTLQTAACCSTTPLGIPVLPEVKMIQASADKSTTGSSCASRALGCVWSSITSVAPAFRTASMATIIYRDRSMQTGTMTTWLRLRLASGHVAVRSVAAKLLESASNCVYDKSSSQTHTAGALGFVMH
ncbi:hypothetical protein TASIC1_0005068800 [Trichoderma asperellum]|uniref:Uncharacterized protein n=1 Tax=Trichoderma asperellum TaxID=101201 RepID=A0A6V8QU01_TRIAP|nr:hypothetical protein TASIC1_0005068800 [Trichoderma asperellum]